MGHGRVHVWALTLTNHKLLVHFCPQSKPELLACNRKDREREIEISSIAVLVTKSMAFFPEDVYQYISAEEFSQRSKFDITEQRCFTIVPIYVSET